MTNMTKDRRGAQGANIEQYVLEDIRIVRETDKALLIAITDHDEEWIPKSQIDRDKSTAHEPGDHGDLVVSMWLAKKNEWVPSS